MVGITNRQETGYGLLLNYESELNKQLEWAIGIAEVISKLLPYINQENEVTDMDITVLEGIVKGVEAKAEELLGHRDTLVKFIDEFKTEAEAAKSAVEAAFEQVKSNVEGDAKQVVDDAKATVTEAVGGTAPNTTVADETGNSSQVESPAHKAARLKLAEVEANEAEADATPLDSSPSTTDSAATDSTPTQETTADSSPSSTGSVSVPLVTDGGSSSTADTTATDSNPGSTAPGSSAPIGQ